MTKGFTNDVIQEAMQTLPQETDPEGLNMSFSTTKRREDLA